MKALEALVISGAFGVGLTLVTMGLYLATEPLSAAVRRSLRRNRARAVRNLRRYARTTHLRHQELRSDIAWTLANVLAFTSSDARLNYHRKTEG